ncbi:MAG: glycogen synthase GlgA [Elusimicrobia bacterium]|nr:glycogen synthase GlgA [Elusimicrobiota bacterium]
MNIVLAASEAVPFCKTGGLADVVGALARELSSFKEHRVVLFLPKYKEVSDSADGAQPFQAEFSVPMAGRQEQTRLYKTHLDNAAVYFVENAKFFDRAGLYGESGDYPDNDERYAFFSRAILEALKLIRFQPDIIHCHDWQTGLTPAYLKRFYKKDSILNAAATLLTVHNMAYQGVFRRERFPLTGFDWSEFTPEKMEFYGGFSFLKSGLVYADKISTVSPTYAREIQAGPEKGCGLEGVLKSRSADLRGILNGIDLDIWNPGADKHLAKNYAAETLDGKKSCKQFLQKMCWLKEDPDVPLAGVVSRLDPQKGLDVAASVMGPMLEQNRLQWVVLGQGHDDLEKQFRDLARKFPGRVWVNDDFNDPLAHHIYAGADLFLMPSRFEPCGLGQMIAMRYGTVPVVARTGGLADTVTDFLQLGNRATGFFAEAVSAADLEHALESALEAYRQPDHWKQLMQNGMRGDYSWRNSVGKYLELYAEIKP